MAVEIKKKQIELKELRKIQGSIEKIVSANIPNEKVRYRLSKLASVFANELTELEKTRQRLVKELGEKKAQGHIEIKDAREKEFHDKFDPLLDESVEVSFIPVDLTGISAGLNALDMLNLEQFLDPKYIDKMMSDDEPKPEEAKT